MLRKLMLLLAFVAVFGQVLSGAWLPTGQAGGGFAHALEHAQDNAHHHHDDGGMHIADAEEAAFHVHLDGASPAALPAGVGLVAALTVPQGPPSMQSSVLPAPPVDGLLRPPKNAS